MQNFRRKPPQQPRAIAAARPMAPSWLWALFLLLSFGVVSLARGEYKSAELQAQYESCIHATDDPLKNIKVRNFSMDQWRERAGDICRENTPNASYNHRMANFGKVPARLITHNSDIGDSTDMNQEAGACAQLSEGLVRARGAMINQNNELCKKTFDRINAMSTCYNEDNIKDCTKNWGDINKALEEQRNLLKAMAENTATFLKPLVENSKITLNAYESDLAKLKDDRDLGKKILNSRNDFKNVDALAGGKQDIGQYYEALEYGQNSAITGKAMIGPTDNSYSPKGMLIIEHRDLQKSANDFAKAYKDFSTAQFNTIGRQLQNVYGFVDKTDSMKGTDLLPYAGAGSSLLSGGGAAAAAPLAAAAATGAAAMSANSKTSSLSESGAAPTAATAASAALGDASGSSAPAAGNAAAPGTTNNIAAGNTPATEAPAVKTGSVKFGADTYVPTGSSGSSRGGTAIAPGSSGGAAHVVASSGGAGGKMGEEDYIRNFSNNLSPLPAAKKKNDSDNEFNNILGQMTKMFNFDDPSKNAPPMEPTADTGMPSGEQAANADFNDGFTYGGGGSGDGSSEGSESEDGRSMASVQPDDPKNIQFGSISTPLFQRVHNRHHISMEKGLVILQVGRLPQ